MNKLKALIMLLLFFVVALFAIQNAAVVEIQFLFWGFSIPRALLVLALLLIGFVFGLLVSSLSALRTKNE